MEPDRAKTNLAPEVQVAETHRADAFIGVPVRLRSRTLRLVTRGRRHIRLSQLLRIRRGAGDSFCVNGDASGQRAGDKNSGKQFHLSLSSSSKGKCGSGTDSARVRVHRN